MFTAACSRVLNRGAARRRRGLGKAAAVLAIAGLALAAPSSQAAFPGQNGEIAFERLVPSPGFSVSSQSEIFTMTGEGALQLNRTNHEADDVAPSFSADGSKIAFVSGRLPGTGRQIYMMNADGTGLTRLTFGEIDGQPAFSRNGKKIVFTSSRDGNREIYTMDAADADGDGKGDNLTRLTTSAGSETDPTFFPNSSKIAFNRGRDLYTMNGDGTGQALLASEALEPDFSPDGSRIAFTRIGLAGDIWTMNADGTGQRNLTNTSTIESAPAFSPDGTKIAYNARPALDFEIYTMNSADGSLPVNISRSPGLPDYAPSWGVRPGTAAPVPAVNEQCKDGIDNDGDGKVDHPDDPGCSSPEDDSEDADPGPPMPQCSDGRDNDGDGKVDYPDDLGCESPEDDSESPDPELPLEADVSVTQTDDPDPGAVYSDVAYTITVRNDGPRQVRGDDLIDELPADVGFVSATAASTAGAYAYCDEQPSGRILKCSLYLDPGKSMTVEVVVRPLAEGQLTNAASVQVGNQGITDPDLSNNSATETTMVGPGPPSLWSDTGALTDARLFGHSATVLKSGKVLVAGGGGTAGKPLASAEIYDPKTGEWSATGAMKVARMDHTATVLDDGRVVIAGGSDGRNFPTLLNSIEIYDPVKGTFTQAGGMTWGRASGTATLLPAATPGEPRTRVLFIGGDGYFNPQPEIYDPAAGTTVLTGPLANDRNGHTATVLEGSGCAPNCGRVLVVGGEPDTFASQKRHTPELSVDPMGGSWALTGNEVDRRYIGHSATALKDGTVLIAGGNRLGFFVPNVLAASELYDPVAGTFAATGKMAAPRHGHAVVRLASGKVLVAGGRNDAGVPLSSVEVYDPAAKTWSAVGPMLRVRAKPTRFASYGDIGVSQNGPSATLLTGSAAVCGDNCGKVLVVGGSGEKTAELYSESLPSSSPGDGSGDGGGDTGGGSGTGDGGSGTGDAGSGPGGSGMGGGGSAVAPGTGGAQEGGRGQDGGPVQDGGGQGGDGVGLLGAERVRARGWRRCLRGVARRFPLRSRGRASRAYRRAVSRRRAGRGRCVRRFGRRPGRVRGLAASAASKTKVVLTFRAPGTDRRRGPAARSYLVKQATRPIRGGRGFRRAQALCKGSCRFSVTRVGTKITLTVTGLRPNTTYYYAVAARDNVSGRLGPRSSAVKTRTR